MDITFIVNRIYAECGLSTYAWNEKDELIHKATAWTESSDTLECDESIRGELRKRWLKQKSPVILMEDVLLESYMPELINSPMLGMVKGMKISEMLQFSPDQIGEDKLIELRAALDGID